MRPEISTTAYQFSHGKMPRGRGTWLFWIRPYRGASDEKSELFHGFRPGMKLYSEAREEAVSRCYDLYAGDAGYIEVAS